MHQMAHSADLAALLEYGCRLRAEINAASVPSGERVPDPVRWHQAMLRRELRACLTRIAAVREAPEVQE